MYACDEFKFVSWNISLGGENEEDILVKFFMKNNYDAVAVQEYCMGPTAARIKRKGAYMIFISGSEENIKVPAIFLHNKWKQSFEKCDGSDKMIMIDIATVKMTKEGSEEKQQN